MNLSDVKVGDEVIGVKSFCKGKTGIVQNVTELGTILVQVRSLNDRQYYFMPAELEPVLPKGVVESVAQPDVIDIPIPELDLTNVPEHLHPFANDLWKVYVQAFTVLVQKQNDYGPNNIARAPGGPENGLMVRLFDKNSRLENLLKNQVSTANEPLDDTFLDIGNYGLIGLAVRQGVWPGVIK